MRETAQSTEEIVRDMLSGDPYKIWSASCAICSLSQNHDRIMELLPYRRQMVFATTGVELGGAFASNSRFRDEAYKIMDFHERATGCPCRLLGEGNNPLHLVEDGYFSLIETVYSVLNPHYVDYYIVRCISCGTVYKVEEREYHYIWWRWVKAGEDPAISTPAP